MAAVLTSEEALNGIFNILQTTIDQYNEDKKNNNKSSDSKTGDMIANLLLGSIDATKKGEKSLGELIEGLAIGLNQLSKIDPLKLNNVANSINSFIKNLTTSLPSPLDTYKYIKPIQDLMAGISMVITAGVMDMHASLNPMKGRMLGRLIGQFLEEILKATKGAKIDLSMIYLGRLLSPLTKLIDPLNKANVHNIKAVLNKKTAKQIASFFKTLINSYPNDVEVNTSLRTVISLLDPLIKLSADKGPMSAARMMLTLNKTTGRVIGGFFKAFVDELPDLEYTKNTMEGVVTILNAIFNAKKKLLDMIEYFAKAAKPEYAESINKFIKELISGEWDEKKLDTVSRFVSGINSVLKTLVGSLIIITLAAVFAPGAVILATVILGIVIMFNKYMIKSLSEMDLSLVDKATNVLIASSKAIFILMGSVSLLALVTKIAGIASVVASVIVLRLVIGFMTGLINELNSKEIQEGVVNAIKATQSMAILLMAITVSTMLLAFTVAKAGIKNIVIGLFIVGIICAGMVHMVKKLAEIENGVDSAGNTLLKVSVAFGIIALITNLVLIPIGRRPKNAIVGAAIILLILGALITGVYMLTGLSLLSFFKNSGTNTLIKLTLIYWALAAITKEMIIPIGVMAKEALYGSAVILAILGALILGVKILSEVGSKTIAESLIATVVLATIFVGIGLIVKDLLIPMGEQAKKAIFGTGVILIILAGLIAGVWALSHVKGKDAGYALLATAALALILVGISLIVKEILIPIGQGDNWKSALIGAAVVLGLMTVMGLIMYVIGRFSEKFAAELAIGAIVMTALGVVMMVVGATVGIFAAQAKKVDELNKGGAVFAGAGTIVLLMGLMGIVMTAVGKLVDFLPYTAIGGVAMTAIGALMAIIGATVGVFAEQSKKVYDLNNGGAVFIGAGIITALLAIMGTVMTAVGALTPVLPLIAIGGAVLTAIGGIMGILGLVLNGFLGLIGESLKYNEKKVEAAGKTMVATFVMMYSILDAAAPNLKQMAEIAAIGAMSIPLMAAFGVLNIVIDFIRKTLENVNAKMVTDFRTILVGSDGKGTGNSVLGAINEIVASFGKIDGVASALIISQAIRPIIDTVSLYIDVIMKVATGSYITGYDDNGKPVYEHLQASDFTNAGIAVNTRFNAFLKSLNDGFKGLGKLSSWTMGVISENLKPVIDLVSQYIDVIMKVATGTYIIGYDDNGKPEYEHLEASDFGKAADVVTTNFLSFLSSLSDGFGSLASLGGLVMLVMGDSIKPVIDTVSGFVDSVLKVATGQYITGYDSNGKPEYEQLTSTDFCQAAVDISYYFKDFLTKLAESMDAYSIGTFLALDSMKDSIAPVMDGVSHFVDAILKLATGQYIDHYEKDKDGNYTVPHYAVVTKTMYEDAATTIAEKFADFVTKLTNSFQGDFWGSRTEDALDAIGSSIGPVMEGVGTYVEAILKLATGTYVDHMVKDKDGKYVPIYKHLTPGMFKNAAKTVGRMFVEFIKYLTILLLNPDFLAKVKAVQDVIKDSIGPVMKAVKDYSDALQPFLNMKTGSGKNQQYLCLQPGKIKQIADGIALSFTSFIGIIATNLSDPKNKKNYESIKGTALQVKQTLSIIKSAVRSFKSVVNDMTDKDGNVISNENEIITKFTNVLTTMGSYFSSASIDFSTAYSNAKSCQKMLAAVYGNVKYYAKIVKSLKDAHEGKENISTLIDKYIKNLNKLSSDKQTAYLYSNGKALGIYANSLSVFGVKAVKTSKNVYVFTTKLEKAKRALAAFDNELINKEKQRNKALDTFAEKINVVAEAVDKMREAFENLDQNAILEDFENIKELLDIAGKTANKQQAKTNTTATKARPTAATHTVAKPTAAKPAQKQTAGQAAARTNGQHHYAGGQQQPSLPASGRVVFEFKDTRLVGFYHQ